MTSRNRESLKHYFREGALPNEGHFADLIDSMLNMSDEGFRKSVENGFEVSALAGHDALISFFRDQEQENPAWRLELAGARDALLLRGSAPRDNIGEDGQPAAPALLTLQHDLVHPAVGIGTESPQATLDVAGVLRSQGRQGASARRIETPLLANGQWQDLTDELQGCQAFEVMAGAGHSGEGRFGLLHAVALNTYNPTLGLFNLFNRKRGIRCTHGYYSRRCDRLQLRWHGSSGRQASYRLQIRSGCDFGAGVQIQAQLTQLWFDPHMKGGQP
ncbi:hypothetical protein [Paludibacterium purpuratum]|uniref:Uncharacterized protein n=1 Tax=Paludibacterium purpuratum TaxID=1144873 RepID=A0A4R7BG92_9NEIS|nr:hypothetical protein [Paludibacterium purpuratum]TDR82777.1 hypothetical protein DFP86_101166 [Paludibacterium purpuratum]